jgi:hypothetical protein
VERRRRKLAARLPDVKTLSTRLWIFKVVSFAHCFHMHFKNTHSCFYLSTAICLPPATNYSLGDSLFSLLGFATDLPAFEAGLVCSQWGVCFTDDCEIRSTLSLSLSLSTNLPCSAFCVSKDNFYSLAGSSKYCHNPS